LVDTIGYILVIRLLTYIVALGRFSHIVAGSADTALVVFTGDASVGDDLGWVPGADSHR
jgi:formate/nitrite transporter FocA (FNT family)